MSGYRRKDGGSSGAVMTREEKQVHHCCYCGFLSTLKGSTRHHQVDSFCHFWHTLTLLPLRFPLFGRHVPLTKDVNASFFSKPLIAAYSILCCVSLCSFSSMTFLHVRFFFFLLFGAPSSQIAFLCCNLSRQIMISTICQTLCLLYAHQWPL